MATVYLCIGTMKTGTSALQAFMGRNREVLNKKGYCYPYMDLGLKTLFDNRNARFLMYKGVDNPVEREAGKEAEKALRNKGYKIIEEYAKKYENIVLSEEEIWHLYTNTDNFWEEAAENFKKIGCNIKVVVYLRRQDLLVQSLWNQQVKDFIKCSDTFGDYIKKGKYKFYPLDYYKQLEYIANYVGKENIIVRVYEKGQFEGKEGNIFSDYLKAIGLEFGSEYIMEKSIEVRNKGLEGNFIEMKRVINGITKYKKSDDFMRGPMRSACALFSGDNLHSKETMFEYEDQLKFMSQFEDGNRRIAMEYMGREDGVLFREAVEKDKVWKLNEETIYRDMLTFVGEMFCYQEKRINELEKEVRELKKFKEEYLPKLSEEDKKVESMYNSAIFRGYRKVRKSIKKTED